MFEYETIQDGYVIYDNNQVLPGCVVRDLLNELTLDRELPESQMKGINKKVILNGKSFENFMIETLPIPYIDSKGTRFSPELPCVYIYRNKYSLDPTSTYWFDEKDMSQYIINDVFTTIIINAERGS